MSLQSVLWRTSIFNDFTFYTIWWLRFWGDALNCYLMLLWPLQSIFMELFVHHIWIKSSWSWMINAICYVNCLCSNSVILITSFVNESLLLEFRKVIFFGKWVSTISTKQLTIGTVDITSVNCVTQKCMHRVFSTDIRFLTYERHVSCALWAGRGPPWVPKRVLAME